MSLYFNRLNSLSSILFGAAAVAAIVITMPTSADAATRKEVAQIAKTTTVQINNEGSDSPGGSGVIIAKQSNIYTVLTANHVVCDVLDRPGVVCSTDITYSVRTHTGQEYPVKQIQVLQKSKDEPDLAVVIFESAEDYPVATLGDSDQAEIAADVYVAGFPAIYEKSGVARDFAMTPGVVVSHINNAINGYSLIYDAITFTGISGGPVFDAVGRVVAIHGLADASPQSKSETGNSAPGKTGFNAGIPINTFLTIRSQISNSSAVSHNNTATGENPSERLDNPQSARDFYARGVINKEQKNYQGAIDDLNQSIRLDPNYANAYYNRGIARHGLKDYQAAIEDLNQAIRLDPNFARAYNSRGNARNGLKDYQAAIEDYNQAIRIDPNYANAYYNRGIARHGLKDYQGALAGFQKAAELYQNQGNIKFYQQTLYDIRKLRLLYDQGL